MWCLDLDCLTKSWPMILTIDRSSLSEIANSFRGGYKGSLLGLTGMIDPFLVTLFGVTVRAYVADKWIRF